MKAMSEDEEGREKVTKRENEINEKIARQLEKNIQQERPKSRPQKSRKSKTTRKQI